MAFARRGPDAPSALRALQATLRRPSGSRVLVVREPTLTPDEPLEFIDGVPRLVAGRCTRCDDISFPLRTLCQKCGSPITRIHLPTHGVLWTWTSQEFEPPSPPSSPEPHQPFT